MSNQYMSLALFLMLLSFFIILNGTSGFDEVRQRPVLNSISLAFSNKTQEQGRAPLVEFFQESLINEGDALVRIESLFTSHITHVDAEKNTIGNVMRLRLPVGAFERGIDTSVIDEETGEYDFSGERGTFLPTLISLMNSSDADLPYRMDMILNTSADPATMLEQQPETLKEKLKLAATLSNKIERAGMPKEMLSTGLGEGDNGYITLYFRPYHPYNPVENIPPQTNTDGG